MGRQPLTRTWPRCTGPYWKPWCLTVRSVPGAGDTHYRPVLSGAATPVGLAFGPGPASEIGLDHALAAPVTPEVIGPRWSPTLWFPVGEGTPKELWQRSRRLMEHLDRG